METHWQINATDGAVIYGAKSSIKASRRAIFMVMA